MDADHLYEETIRVPRAVRFPVELRQPPGFRADDPRTWPQVDGSLEYVGGRLLFMPPSGDVQQDVVAGIVGLLDRWLDAHPEFKLATNEAGVLLDGDARGIDVAIWRRDALSGYTGRYRRVPPVLAVEVAGADQGEHELREKAAWYISRGVKVVWIVLPEFRTVLILRPGSEIRLLDGERLPSYPELPDLTPDVKSVFRGLE
jgi:Uma2 family endonuclease